MQPLNENVMHSKWRDLKGHEMGVRRGWIYQAME